jgi:hypothetical protein
MALSDALPSQRQAAMLVLAFAAGVAVGANWPAIRQALGPLLAMAGDKLDDIYSAVSQTLGEQKEAMDDARAERRHRARAGQPAGGAEQELLTSLGSLLNGGKRPAARRAARRPVRRRARKTSGRATSAGTSAS